MRYRVYVDVVQHWYQGVVYPHRATNGLITNETGIAEHDRTRLPDTM